MNTVIGKKRVNQIEVGDVVGLIGNWLNYTDQHDERLVTVLSVEQTQRTLSGEYVNGKVYEIACSDGHTYEISSGARQYFIFASEVK